MRNISRRLFLKRAAQASAAAAVLTLPDDGVTLRSMAHPSGGQKWGVISSSAVIDHRIVLIDPQRWVRMDELPKWDKAGVDYVVLKTVGGQWLWGDTYVEEYALISHGYGHQS
jgi:hypothetical protein